MRSQLTRTIQSAALSMCAVMTLSCASGTGAAPGTGAPAAVAVRPVGGSQRGVGLEVTTRNDGQDVSLQATPIAVFAALEASYEALLIPLSRREPDARILGNTGLKMRRQLGKIELRRAFDCGGTSGMPNAETYTLTASILSTIAPTTTDGSVVTTVVDASAENPSYPGSAVQCSSNGTIENAIANETRTRLNLRK
jgi:hypothetical protein